MVRYGSASIQGLRDYQEDRVAFLYSAGGNRSSSDSGGGGTMLGSGNSLAVAVYDGHGGDQISKELERVLLQVRKCRRSSCRIFRLPIPIYCAWCRIF